MKRMVKWMLAVLLLTMVGCSSDDEPDEQVLCERIEVEQTEYCVYEQPITETGYDCPQDLMNPIPFDAGTVCSGAREIPSEHERPIRDRMTESNGTSDAGPDTLSCEERRRCDASLALVQNFVVNQPDGSTYCGPLTIRHWPVEDDQDVRTSTCVCSEGELQTDGANDPCHILLGGLENMTVVIEAEAPDYATFTTEVDIPCCNPSNSLIQVDFEAAE